MLLGATRGDMVWPARTTGLTVPRGDAPPGGAAVDPELLRSTVDGTTLDGMPGAPALRKLESLRFSNIREAAIVRFSLRSAVLLAILDSGARILDPRPWIQDPIKDPRSWILDPNPICVFVVCVSGLLAILLY
jgi:hypothetical protein